MKIGAFAKKNRVGIDTIRHYMDLELIIPQKPAKQYEFDLQCQKDFDEIVSLKSLGFTLSEIKNIFIVKHLGKMTSFLQEDRYKSLFKEKYESTTAEIEKLSRVRSGLKEELRRLDAKSEDRQCRMGVGLSCLQHLRCGLCGSPLVLKEAAIEDDMILSGTLKCPCGAEYPVRDGILFAGAVRDGADQPPDILSYIQHTDTAYLNRIYKTLEWDVQNIDFKSLSGKLVLELGSGSGFFLRRIYNELPEDTVYIAVDHDPGKLRFLKEALEKSGGRRNILFLCCDFAQMPLSPRSIDVICDYSGTSNYSFDHGEFLLESIERYYKLDAALLGSYIIFKNFSQNSMVPMDCRPNFRLDAVKKQIEKLGFSKQAEYTSDVVTKGGIYEDYFRDDEKILTYSFVGKRSG
jgi:DNA-binding transcriptional MerR regulator/ubiquinone/menaquinone biosynthesis C-methylase UbiE